MTMTDLQGRTSSAGVVALMLAFAVSATFGDNGGCCLFGVSPSGLPIDGVEVAGQVTGFAWGDIHYDEYDKPEFKLLMSLVEDAALRVETANPKLATDARVGPDGRFEFERLSGRGLHLRKVYYQTGVTTYRTEGLLDRPDSLVLTMNESGANPYVQTTRTTTIFLNDEYGVEGGWRDPRTAREGLLEEWYADGLDFRAEGRVWRFAFSLTARMTDSAATYLANSYVRPCASAALKRTCVQAARGDYAAAIDSLEEARSWNRRLRKLLPDSTSYASLEDSLKLAERLIEASRSGWKMRTAKELIAAARDLVVAKATYEALEYELQNYTLTADMQRKAQELQSYAGRTLQPAMARFQRAMRNYGLTSSPGELHDLALENGFSSLLR
jgi:hypothetical protein